ECQACSYVYDAKQVDKPPDDSGKAPSSEGLPADWICPVCGVGPEFFEEVSGRSS
ncbi:MAG: rubredoxin, partial [Candidatus Fermentibacteria bacterium]|nr:rubredoxin [Candidatus Fermentibacteria bacterium]